MIDFLFSSSQKGVEVGLQYGNTEKQLKGGLEIIVEFGKQIGILNTVFYVIHVQTHKDVKYKFIKRFSDLEQFFFMLREKLPFVVFPSFPSKDMSMLYFTDKEKLDRRKEDIRVFMGKLISNTILQHTNYLEVLKKFKKANETQFIEIFNLSSWNSKGKANKEV